MVGIDQIKGRRIHHLVIDDPIDPPEPRWTMRLQLYGLKRPKYGKRLWRLRPPLPGHTWGRTGWDLHAPTHMVIHPSSAYLTVNGVRMTAKDVQFVERSK